MAPSWTKDKNLQHDWTKNNEKIFRFLVFRSSVCWVHTDDGEVGEDCPFVAWKWKINFKKTYYFPAP